MQVVMGSSEASFEVKSATNLCCAVRLTERTYLHTGEQTSPFVWLRFSGIF